MNFDRFATRAQQIYDEIPPDFKEGVDGLEVTRRAVPHPTLPEVYTLGECISEQYPSDYGGAGEIRSMVVLYYGSFLELSRARDDWNWEEELWETITHELRHHLEHLALDDSLGDTDRAEDENFARREGRPFDPFFFRDGTRRGEALYEVDRDLFLECAIEYRRHRPGELLPVELDGRPIRLFRPAEEADVHFLRIEDPPVIVEGDFYVVLNRRRGVVEWLRGVFDSRPLRVLESDAEVAAD